MATGMQELHRDQISDIPRQTRGERPVLHEVIHPSAASTGSSGVAPRSRRC